MAGPTDLADLHQLQIEALLDDVLDALIVTDPQGNLLYMNDAAYDLYGFGQLEPSLRDGPNLLRYSREAFDISEVNGEKVTEEDQPLSRALRGEWYRDVELWVRHKEGGRKRIFSFSGTRLEGDPVLGVLTIRDVTEQHKAQRRYRIAFETNPAPTLIARLADGELVDVNDGFTEMTGFSKEQTRGKSVAGLGLLAADDHLLRVIDELKEGRIVHQRKTKINRSGAEERDVFVSARPIEIDWEQCGIFTFLDITDLLDARELAERRTAELREANDELHAFNNSVAHDLRAPLRGVHGFSQVLLEDYADRLDDKGRNYLERVMAGAERLGGLLDALLQMSQLTRGRLEIDTVDLSAIGRETERLLRMREPERQAVFEIAEGLKVRGDEHLLRAAIEGLLENAWKFTRRSPKGRIELGCERRQDGVVYFVRDNGASFDMRYVDKLFVPFQRLHRQDEFEGRGMGLATVHRIIKRHGGTIWGRGDLGEGATFYFTLPAPWSRT